MSGICIILTNLLGKHDYLSGKSTRLFVRNVVMITYQVGHKVKSKFKVPSVFFNYFRILSSLKSYIINRLFSKIQIQSSLSKWLTITSCLHIYVICIHKMFQSNGVFDDPGWNDYQCVLRKYVYIKGCPITLASDMLGNRAKILWHPVLFYA